MRSPSGLFIRKVTHAQAQRRPSCRLSPAAGPRGLRRTRHRRPPHPAAAGPWRPSSARGGRLAGLYRRGSGPNPKRPRLQGGGKVLERRVETGQSVKRGQLLLRLDPADLALQAQSQQRAVDAAQARAKKAANDLARYRGLVASGAISAAEFDQINAAAEAARADLSAARAGQCGAKRHRLCRTAGGC